MVACLASLLGAGVLLVAARYCFLIRDIRAARLGKCFNWRKFVLIGRIRVRDWGNF